MQILSLTDDVVRGLPFAEFGRRRVFVDAEIGGMRLVVGADRKSFHYCHRDGHALLQRRWLIGWFPEMPVERARELACRLDAACQQGLPLREVGGRHPTSESTEWTFASVAEAFITELPSRRYNKSIKKDEAVIRRNLMDGTMNPWAEKDIRRVTDQDVASLIETIRRRPAPAVALTCLRKVKMIFKWATHPHRRGQFGLPSDPIADLTPRMLCLRSNIRSRVLCLREVRSFLQVVDLLASVSHRTLARCAILSRRRIGQLASMRWSKLDLERRTWTCDHGFMREETIPLSDAMVAALRELRQNRVEEDGDFVFGVNGREPSPASLQRLKATIARAMAQAAVDRGNALECAPWCWTDLRRSVSCMLRALDIRSEVRNAVVGRGSGLDRSEAIRTILNRHAAALEGLRAEPPRGPYSEL